MAGLFMEVIVSQMAACSPERLVYRLDVLGVEDRGDRSQLEVHKEFVETTTRKADGR